MNNFGNINNKEVVYTNYPFCYSELPSDCKIVHYDNFLYQYWLVIEILLLILGITLIGFSIKKYLVNKKIGKLIWKIIFIILGILILYSLLFSNMTVTDILIG